MKLKASSKYCIQYAVPSAAMLATFMSLLALHARMKTRIITTFLVLGIVATFALAGALAS
jgi:hypothetical protein